MRGRQTDGPAEGTVTQNMFPEAAGIKAGILKLPLLPRVSESHAGWLSCVRTQRNPLPNLCLQKNSVSEATLLPGLAIGTVMDAELDGCAFKPSENSKGLMHAH